MSEKPTGGLVFPAWKLNRQGQSEMTDFGMTLRDYFAAKAMQSMTVNPPTYIKSGDWINNIACEAYRMADAMLKAREQ